MQLGNTDFLTFKAAQKLLDSIPIHNDAYALRDYSVILILLSSGFKLGHLLEMSVADGNLMIHRTKNAEQMAWIQLCSNRASSSALISNGNSKSLTSRNMQRRIQMWASNAKLGSITPTMLTNTCLVRNLCRHFLLDDWEWVDMSRVLK